MAVNRERPHLIVLPEDEATRSLATGFSDQAQGPIDIQRPARGWKHVLEAFERDHVGYLRKYPCAHIVLLIDYDDDHPNRLTRFQERIPPDVADRVYVLGALTEAENLRRETGRKLGPLGSALGQECRDGTSTLWQTAQLRHNAGELARLEHQVKPFLFRP